MEININDRSNSPDVYFWGTFGVQETGVVLHSLRPRPPDLDYDMKLNSMLFLEGFCPVLN